MKTLGIRPVIIRQLANFAELEALTKEPRVAERAANIKEIGLMHEPWIRQSDMRTIVGRDRLAAHLFNGEKTCLVKFVECSDEELDVYEIAENFQRRHSNEERAALEARVLARLEAKEAKRREDFANGTPKVGGRISAVGKARKVIAMLTGVNPETVRQRQNRAKRRATEKVVEAAQAGAPIVPTEAPILLLGMDVGQGFVAGVTAADAYIATARKGLRAAQDALGNLKAAELPYPSGLLSRLRDDVHDLYERLKLAKPYSLCPSCKGLAGIQEHCAGCVNTGVITVGQKPGVPAVLWAEGDQAMVQDRGALRSVWDVIERPGEEPEADSEWGDMFDDL